MLPDTLRRIAKRLTDPSATEEERVDLYAALRECSDGLKLRDLERRHELVCFSNGLEITAQQIAEFCGRHGIADFCIVHGLSRAEVLERTGLSKAGVR
jgi:hypothetical protein